MESLSYEDVKNGYISILKKQVNNYLCKYNINESDKNYKRLYKEYTFHISKNLSEAFFLNLYKQKFNENPWEKNNETTNK